MAYNKYASFYAAYNASVKKGNPSTKEETISNFTGGRTDSLKGLSDAELQELVRNLNATSGHQHALTNTTGDKMRKGIIAIFKKMGRTTADAIAWAEKQGVKQQKKPFNDYTNGELYVLLGVAEIILKDWQTAIRKKINTI